MSRTLWTGSSTVVDTVGYPSKRRPGLDQGSRIGPFVSVGCPSPDTTLGSLISLSPTKRRESGSGTVYDFSRRDFFFLSLYLVLGKGHV